MKVLKIKNSCGGQGCQTHEEILPKGIKIIRIETKVVEIKKAA